MKYMRRTAGCSLLDHMRNEHILDKMKVTPVTEYVNQTKLATTCVKNGQSQYSKPNVLICPCWTATARKTKEKMVRS
jgi:hypothetical protein